MKKEQFLSAGVHIGMKSRTGYMQDYVYKIRPDGLTVLNLQTIIEKIKVVGDFLAKYNPERIIVVAGREQAQKPAKKFAHIIGAQVIAGRFYPGTLTNYIKNADVMLSTDLIADKQAVTEAVQMGLPVVSMVNVNDIPVNVDLIIPCNNRGKKALAVIFWALATFFLRAKGDIPANSDISEPAEEFMK